MPTINYDLYDSINTLAVRWLIYNAKERKLPLGIKHFDRKNLIHMWLLHIMNAYSIANNYQNFYVNCSLFNYLYIKYTQNIKNMKRVRKKTNVFLIEPDLFSYEVCKAHTLEDNSIISDIYKEYWI